MMWPSPQVAASLQGAWRSATPDERKYILGISCGCSVTYLRISEVMLASRSTRDEIERAREEYMLNDLEWAMERPRSVSPGREVCEDDAFMDFLVEFCRMPNSEVIDLVQHSKSPLVPVDRIQRKLSSGRATTWEGFARDFWAVLLFDMSTHTEAASNRRLCFEIIKTLLEKKDVQPARRSWPTQRTLQEVREEWETLSLEDRVKLTNMTSSEYWFVQACDLAMTCSNFRSLKKLGLQLAEDSVMFRPEIQGTIISNLRVEVGPELYLMLSEEFLAQPDCLKLLIDKSLRSAAEKDALLAIVYSFRFECIFESGVLKEEFQAESSWARVERIVATLLLDHLLRRLQHVKTCRAQAKAGELEKQIASLQKKQEAQQKRRLKAREKRTQGTMLQQPPALLSSDQGEGSEAWKADVRSFLASAPSWDASCLYVDKTFISLKEEPSPSDEDLEERRSWA